MTSLESMDREFRFWLSIVSLAVTTIAATAWWVRIYMAHRRRVKSIKKMFGDNNG